MRQKCLAIAVLTATVLAAACAPPDSDRQNISLKGSDTMVLLGQKWAEVYMNGHPDAVVQVTGGGSGTGIAALINGTTDICQASRAMTAQEKEAAKQKRNAEVVEIPVALDALALYVHKDNPIGHLTIEQAARIFKGEITNWKDVGGSDAGIVLYGRENNSGTYVYFKEHVLANADFADRYQPLGGTAAVINAITKDPGGVGYGGIGYATEVKTLAVAKDAGASPVAPTMENALNNTYPISRQLFWYTLGQPSGGIKAFVDWVLGPEGQKVITEVGFYPLRADSATR
jgi:phosphate transport system substrate-binding protein